MAKVVATCDNFAVYKQQRLDEKGFRIFVKGAAKLTVALTRDFPDDASYLPRMLAQSAVGNDPAPDRHIA